MEESANPAGFGRRRHGISAAAIRVLALVIFLLSPLPNRAHSAAVRIPFRTAESMILVEGKVNDNRVTFLLDTGADNTVISLKALGRQQIFLYALHVNDKGPGMTGNGLRLRADVAFANHVWKSQPVSVMNVDALTERFRTPIDGILGQDILRQFHSVRIDYHARMIELEQ
jgi:Aspartyl protease